MSPRIQYAVSPQLHTFAAAACAATVYMSVGIAAAREISDHEIVYDSPGSVVATSAVPECTLTIDHDVVDSIKSQKNAIKFQKLVQQWRDERGAMSSITEMSMLTPYQNIIGMGLDAIPLIIAELKSEGDDPDQWFWALMSICDTNQPRIKPEDQGNYRKMSQAWLEWAEKGYAG